MKLQDFDFRIWDKKRQFFLEKQKIDTTADDKVIAAGILRFLGKDSYLGFGEVWEHKHKTLKDYTIIGFNVGDETTQNLEIELYFGVKDRNGVKIFDGDIVKVWDEYESVSFVDIVAFDKGLPRFCFKQSNALVGYYENKNLEVIGNIHENPELIEQTKNTRNKNA